MHNDRVVDTLIKRKTVADKDIGKDVKRLRAKDSLDDFKVEVIKLTGKVATQTTRVRAAMVSRRVRPRASAP